MQHCIINGIPELSYVTVMLACYHVTVMLSCWYGTVCSVFCEVKELETIVILETWIISNTAFIQCSKPLLGGVHTSRRKQIHTPNRCDFKPDTIDNIQNNSHVCTNMQKHLDGFI